jgi:glycosyltransferase involved in cell wall biosynthesis
MSQSPLLSFIVPFYNNEEFIVACLRSLFEQAGADIEIIIIDDGSTDDSARLVNQYLAKHPYLINVKFISQENGGVAQARNAGMAVAEGRYITFMDGDDLLSNDYLRHLHPILMAEEYDLIDFKYQKFCDVPLENAVDNQTRLKVYDFHAKGISCLEPLFAISMWHVWSRVYKRSLLTGETFTSGRCYEDVIFTPYIYFKTQKIAHLDHELYLYRDNIHGITRNIKAKDIEDLQFAVSKMILFAEQHVGNEPLRKLAALMIANCFTEIRSMSKKIHGYYRYDKQACELFRKAVAVCQASNVPGKKLAQMQYPQVDIWLSKTRWWLKNR